jgi:hypothetical protein
MEAPISLKRWRNMITPSTSKAAHVKMKINRNITAFSSRLVQRPPTGTNIHSLALALRTPSRPAVHAMNLAIPSQGVSPVARRTAASRVYVIIHF